MIKPIPLYMHHLELLLEMTSYYFPTYKFRLGNNGQILIIHENFRITHECIHWFQFCLTCLSEEIFFRCYNQESIQKYQEFCLNCNLYWDGRNSEQKLHPIELLYKEHKAKLS